MNKKLYINHYLTLFKVTTLLFTLSSNPVWANIKIAHGTTSNGAPLTRTYTFSGDVNMNVSSAQPAYIVFSKARDNPNNGHFQYSEMNAQSNSLAPFNQWIYAQSSIETGYSFSGFTCSRNCPQMQLPLLLSPDNAYLKPTSQTDDHGGTIFALQNYPNVGISFQIGVRTTNSTEEWVSATNSTTLLKTLSAYFDTQDKTLFNLRAKFHLLTNFSSLSNDEVIGSMNVKIGEIKLRTWYSQSSNYFDTRYVVQDTGKISIFFQIPKIILKKQQRQCTLDSNPVSPNPVKLPAVNKRQLETKKEIESVQFKLRANCSNTTYNKPNGKWLFPLVKVTFTGKNNTMNNGQNDLLYTETAQGQAKGVSLKIKRDSGNGDWVKYGLDSHSMDNLGQFELKKQPSPAGGDQNAEETFKVYYVRDPERGDLSEGKVNAAATFTMSYQ